MASKYIGKSANAVMRRLMVALVVLLMVLSIVLEFSLWSHYREHITDEVDKNTAGIVENLQILLSEQAAGMSIALQSIGLDEKVQIALKEGDHQSLLLDWKPKFDAMKKESLLTEFSFFDANSTNILRLHNLSQNGETLSQGTLLKAKSSRKTSWGLELTPLGTFTLRTVQPIYKQGVLVGYVELGKAIEDILHTLHVSLNSHLAVLIHKKYLNQKEWEEGMRILNRPFKWDSFANSALSYATQGYLPETFTSIVAVPQYEKYLEATFDGKKWLLYVKPLYDTTGQSVGDLIIIYDISAEALVYIQFMLKSGLFGAILLGLVLGFIYILLRQANISIIAGQEVSNRLQKIASRISGIVYQYRLRPDGSSCFPFASEAIQKIYRLSPEEVKEDASKVFTILHPDDIQGVVDSIQQSARDLTPWRHEYRVKFDDGVVRWLFGNAIPEKEEDSSILWHGFIDDITDHKLLEYELKKMNELLDAKVEKEVNARIKVEKEQENERQFLIQKSKLSSMGEMMGAIAHQWRQPLNALNMNIQNLDDDFEEGLVNKTFIDNFIAKNKTTILFMSKTIDDFKNFFKIDKEKKEFSALEAIKETLALQSAQFKNHNILIMIKGEDRLLHGFKGEFQQVILNIVNNAKDAILEQKVQGQITIRIDRESIIIEDNGGGIKDETLERIFEPYFTTKDQGEGIGMGLYMSKMIIEENMNWKLEAQNIPKGARFTIILS
ncbi:MAG: PAS domain-containing protein [Campylobacteraceae bacterium]|nr:PAS domain-containing protein [Campylobacteraceae bacterium]